MKLRKDVLFAYFFGLVVFSMVIWAIIIQLPHPLGLEAQKIEAITGRLPTENETGLVRAEVVSFVSLNLTDNIVQLGNLTNSQVLNTSFEGGGEVKDVLTVENVGASPAEVDFWARYSLFYDRINTTGKCCNGGGIVDCRNIATRSETDPSFKFATEGFDGTGCLIDAYELSVSSYQDVIVDGIGGMNAPQVSDQFAAGDKFNISFRVEVPMYEESGFLNTTIFVSAIEDIDGKDADC